MGRIRQKARRAIRRVVLGAAGKLPYRKIRERSERWLLGWVLERPLREACLSLCSSGAYEDDRTDTMSAKICEICRRECWAARKARALLKQHASDALDMLCSGNDGSNAKAMLECYRRGYAHAEGERIRLEGVLRRIIRECPTCQGAGVTAEYDKPAVRCAGPCRTAREALGMR